MRYALPLTLLLATLVVAQSTQPTTAPATQPVADRSTVLGTFALFDKTVADLGVEKAMAFYHCTTAQQRRYARAECEFYVSVNLLVRAVEKKHGATTARIVRELCGDSDDYTDATVREEGDAAAMVRPGQPPFPLIRQDGKWLFSMPDLFEIQGEALLMKQRPLFEAISDKADALREQIETGRLTSRSAILREASAIREIE